MLLLLCVETLGVAAQEFFPLTICVTWNLTEICAGGDNALTSTDVRLTYNYTESGISRSEEGPILRKGNVSNEMYSLTYPGAGSGEEESREVEYFFEQLEHGGGRCNCLDIYFDCISNSNYRLVDLYEV